MRPGEAESNRVSLCHSCFSLSSVICQYDMSSLLAPLVTNVTVGYQELLAGKMHDVLLKQTKSKEFWHKPCPS